MCRAVGSCILHFCVVEFDLVLKPKRVSGGKGKDQTLNCIGVSTPENTILNDFIASCFGCITAYANPEVVAEDTTSYAHNLK